MGPPTRRAAARSNVSIVHLWMPPSSRVGCRARPLQEQEHNDNVIICQRAADETHFPHDTAKSFARLFGPVSEALIEDAGVASRTILGLANISGYCYMYSRPRIHGGCIWDGYRE